MQVPQVEQDLVLVAQEELQEPQTEAQGQLVVQDLQEARVALVVTDRQGHKAIVCLVILILIGKVLVLVMGQLDKQFFYK